ncbi:MAG: divalent-cation tolerance protein CutA [bacterium]
MYVTVYVTVADSGEAERIARTLVEERLAACVNFFPCRSVYRWKGEIEEAAEYVLICKTQKSLFRRLKSKVKELHSYEVPAIVAFDIVEGHGQFLRWIGDTTLER